MGLYGNEPPKGQTLHIRTRREDMNGPAKDKRPSGEDVPDSMNITEMSRVMDELKTAIARLPEIRAGKVRAIQKKLTEGTYQIDSRKIALGLIDEVL